MKMSSKKSGVYLNILLNDYAEARDDERNFLSVQATSLTLGVTAAAGLLVFFEQVIDRSKTNQFPDLVIAGALMAGFVTIAFALWVGSVATVRAFYLRSLEREIRRVAKLENVVFGDLSLRPISFHELVVEHGSLSKPVSTTTSVLVNIVVIGLITVFGVIGSFLAFQINGKWMIPIVFLMNGAFVLYALRELWVISVGGRDYVQELTQRYKKRLDRDLITLYPRPSPWPTINYEAYSEGVFEDVECECGGDGLFECVQGAAVVGVEDSPGLDVGDGALDDLADPVDALVGLFGRFAQLAVGGLLVGCDHPPSDIALVGDPPGGVDSVEQSGGVHSKNSTR